MDTVTLDALGPGAASAIIMLLADARLPAGAHVTSNGVEAGLRRGLAPREVAAYMRARMRTVVRVEAGTAVGRSGCASHHRTKRAMWRP